MAKKSISDVLIKFKGDNKDLDKSISGSGQKLRSFASSAVSALKKMAVAFGVVAVAASAYSIKQAMTFEGLERAFEGLVSKHGVSSDKFMAQMKAMSYGTVSEMDIMKKANMGLMLGLKPDALITFMETATTISQATGMSAEYMFESLVTGTARQSKQWLDNLGIMISIGEANKRYAAALGLNAMKLTEEEQKIAFSNMALEESKKKLVDLGGYVIDTKNRWDRLIVSFKDASVALGQQLMPEFDKILTWVIDNKDWMVTTFDEIFDIEITNFGDFTVEQLDKVKNWIDENKGDIKWWVDFTKTLTGMKPRPLMGGEGDTVAEQAARHAAAASAEQAYFARGGAPGGPSLPAGGLRQSIQISLDPNAVIKFLSGQVVGVTNFATISGT